MKPLEGIRVLDLSRVLSGPHCGRALADLGADVIKVEPPGGDLSRFAQPRVSSLALYYVQQNTGKRNISLDIGRPEAVDLLRRLADACDVVLENFRPGVMDRMGLGWEVLSARNPRLVYASITGYGQTGPQAGRRAYAHVIHAEVGYAQASLDHRGDHRHEPFSHGDVYAGQAALSGILAALLVRERTGRGQHVDIAMAATLLAANEHAIFDMSDIDPGDEVPMLGPGGAPILDTADGRRMTIAGDPCASQNFPAFCRMMDRADLADDPRFAAPGDRKRNREALVAEVQRWALSFPDLESVGVAVEAAGMAYGVLRTVREAADSDWAAHRGAVAEVGDRAGGTIRLPDAPWRFSDAEVGVAGDPAYRGEHNREVLGGLLGLSDADLDRLEADGVLSERGPTSR